MKRPTFNFDRPLFVALLSLLGLGLIMIASAGVVYGRVRFGDDYYFLKEQLFGLITVSGVDLSSPFLSLPSSFWFSCLFRELGRRCTGRLVG